MHAPARALPTCTSLAAAALVLLLVAAPAGAKTDAIATVAGSGTNGYGGDGGPATAALLSVPVEVEPTADGGYLIVEQGSVHVRRVAPDGTITTLAGNGTTGFGGDNGPAAAASLATPNGVAVRADGSVLIADSANNRVRQVAPNGIITTVAGTGTPGYNGDGIAATAAQLRFPAGLAVTADGGFLIADNDNNRIRRVGPDGIISTVAGTGAAGSGGDGGLATSAQVNDPGGVDVLADGSFVLTEVVGARVRLVAPNGVISTIAGTGVAGGGGDGGLAVSAQLNTPIGIAAVPGGGVLIGDTGNHRVRLVGGDGIIRTVAGTGTAGAAGDGGLATAAQLSSPIGVALTSDGDYLVADASNHRVRRVDAGDAGVPPPPPVPVRNVTEPSISGVGINRKVHYLCDPGTWEGLPEPPAFELSWWRGNPFLQLAQKPKAPTLLANGESYVPKAADIGQLIYCHVRVRDARGVLHEASSFPTVLSGSAAVPPVFKERYGNVRIRGIDVFQVVQPVSGATMYGFPQGPFPTVCGGGTPTDYPSPCGIGVPASPQQARYQGVNLDARKPTYAVVYVDMAGAPTAARLRDQDLLVTLKARLGGRALEGSVVERMHNPPVSTTPWVTFDERNDEDRFGVNVRVPDTWLDAAGAADAHFDLEATVALPVGAGGGMLEECSLLVAGPSCYLDDTFRLERIPVEDGFPALNIRTVALLTKGQSTSGPQALAPPERVLEVGLAMFPGGSHVRVQPYATTIDISSVTTLDATSKACAPFLALADPVRPCRAAVVAQALASFMLDDNPPDRVAYDVLFGVHRYGEGGWSTGNIDGIATIAADDAGRPITGVAHELGHTLGLGHVGPKCAGNSDDWDPDDEGRLQGWMFRVLPRFGAFGGPTVYWRIPDSDPMRLHDLMSYCVKSEDRAWLSPRSWNRLVVGLLAYEARRRSRLSTPTRHLAAAAAAYATGYVTPAGGVIDAVRATGTGTRIPAPDPASTYSLRSLDASGAVLAEVGLGLTPLADAGETSTFAVGIPDGATAVELRRGDALLARRARSRPPTVRVLAPAASARVRPGGSLAVRWTASDPDGDELRVTIEHAANGTSGWRTVFAGPSTGRAAIPASYLEPGPAARLRVTVSDGFGGASAISAPFRAEGRAPSVTIVAPQVGAEAQNGVRTLLAGTASDATGAPLRGAALTWFAGTRRLGTGERLAVRLPAGRTILRLRAHGAGGRTSVATRTVTVVMPPLRLTMLRPPVRVRPGSRTAEFRVATSRAAVLRAGGRTFQVGPKARTLAIRLPASPKLGALRLRIRVGDGGRKAEIDETVVVLRV